MRLALIVASIVLATVLGVLPGHADKRVALVIGNSNYRHAGRLTNPVNDAAAVAALLKSAGFAVVDPGSDVGIAQMRRALSDFADTARDSDIAVVYYAGHGIEVDGVNYLIPVDATLARDFDVEDETISLDRVLRAIDSARRLRLVILDACRTNPFIESMKRSSRAIGRGFARVEPTAPDTLVAFSAKAGSTASDGSGEHSPFTAALLKHIATPGLDVRLALGEVRDAVMASTSPRQEPFVYGSLGGRTISIVDAPATPANTGTESWAAVRETTSIAVLEEFRRQYPQSVYAAFANARIEELKKQQLAVVAPPVRPAPLAHSSTMALYQLIIQKADTGISTFGDFKGQPGAYSSRKNPKALVACLDWRNTTPTEYSGRYYFRTSSSRDPPVSLNAAVTEATSLCVRNNCARESCILVDRNGDNALQPPTDWPRVQ